MMTFVEESSFEIDEEEEQLSENNPNELMAETKFRTKFSILMDRGDSRPVFYQILNDQTAKGDSNKCLGHCHFHISRYNNYSG
jgi:hypothetical protein